MNSEFEQRKQSPFPQITVDTIISINDKIVLIEREYPPLGWALPGGFVEKGESVEDAAKREVLEETGLELVDLKQFNVYSEPTRDPRFHTVTLVFTARGVGAMKADSDAKDIKLFSFDELPELAFDHYKIIADFKKSIN